MAEVIAGARRLRFGPSDLATLKQRLALDNQRKAVVTVESAKQIFLDKQALMAGKYQLTTVGASQYFKALANGLYPAIRALLAEEHPEVNVKKAPELIANLVNRVAAHREAALLGNRAICCEDRLQLDGFVSRSYVFVSNEEVFRLFEDSCELMRYPMKMFLGAISGRELTAVVSSRDPVKASVPGKVYLGAMCQNGETVGRAIRMSTVVVDSISRSWAVEEFARDARIPHVRSRRLREKMMQLGDLLGTRQRKVEANIERYALAANQPIAKSWDTPSIYRMRAGLISNGSDIYINSTHIDAALGFLPDEGSPVPSKLALYHACLQAADQFQVSNSLPLRQLAYRIVFQG